LFVVEGFWARQSNIPSEPLPELGEG